MIDADSNDGTTDKLAPQQALAALARWAAEHSDWPVSSAFDGVLRATFARATKTFNAAVLLTRSGYGPQAGMLARSLFEDMLVAYWMTFCADEAWVLQRIDDRMQFGRLLMRDTAVKHGYLAPGEDIPGDDLATLRDEQPRYAATFGPSGAMSWWAARRVRQKAPTREGEPGRWVVDGRRQLVQLVRDLDATPIPEGGPYDQVVGQNVEEGAHTTLRHYYDIAHNFNNLMLHHSTFGMELHVYGDGGGDPASWNEEPSDQWVAQVELCLFWTYGQLILLICQRLRPELTAEAADVFERTLAAAYGSLAETPQANERG